MRHVKISSFLCVVCVVLTQTSGSKDRLDVVGGIVESPTGSASLPTSKNKQTAPSAPASSSKGGLDDVVESALKTKSEPAKSASTGVASGIDSQSKSVAPSSPKSKIASSTQTSDGSSNVKKAEATISQGSSNNVEVKNSNKVSSLPMPKVAAFQAKSFGGATKKNLKPAFKDVNTEIVDSTHAAPKSNSMYYMIGSIVVVGLIGYFWVRKKKADKARYAYQGIPTAGGFYEEDYSNNDEWGSGSGGTYSSKIHHSSGGSARRRVRSLSSDRDILVDTGDFNDDDFGDDFDDELDLELRS